MNIAVIGLSHKTAPVEIREKLSIPDDAKEQAIAQIRGLSHIQEVAVLSTCNRLEIYALIQDTENGMRELTQFLSDWSKISIAELRPHLFILLHQDAVMHLMRVASGLDSLVLGEGQILSQVKATHQMGQKFKGTGPILDRLLKQAITAGKRVRTETSIGTGAVSISSAAVELAHMKSDNLADSRVAIIGAGKMSRLLVKHLLSKGANQITIVNRSLKRAEELAKQFQEASLELKLMCDMEDTLCNSDLVFTSTGATQPILCRQNLEAVVAQKSTFMVVDISVPRNVDADVAQLSQVRSFNVDDLKAVVAQNQESRRQMAMEAETLLESELDAFVVWWRSLETIPTISSLRSKIEIIREQELEKALSRLGDDFAEKKQREVIEALTKGIVNKILHDPMVQLRAQQDIEMRQQAMESLHMLFNLPTKANQFTN